MDTSPTGWTDGAGSAAARECASIARDLDRLKVLIADAGDRLLKSFNTISEVGPTLQGDQKQRLALARAVGDAVTALQFQDMATQLVQHAQGRLDVLERCLGTSEAADPLLAHTRMQPVRQTGMGSGSIDLF